MLARFQVTPGRLAGLAGFSLAVVLWWWAWPLGRAHYLATTGTWPEKNHSVRELDCLYDVLRTRPITNTGPAIVRCLVEHRPFSYHNGQEGERSWRYPKLSIHERTYYVAEALWREATLQPSSRQALASALPALLHVTISSPQKRLVIHALMQAWNAEARADLIHIASDVNEDIETQAAAVTSLMRHEDAHQYIPIAIEIIRRGGTTDWAQRSFRRDLSPIQRQLYLFHSIVSQAHLDLLQPDDRTQLVQFGLSLLRELPEIDLRSGYFVAGLLGHMVNAPGNFSPNQRDYWINKWGGGLKETYFTDTVKNALAWQPAVTASVLP